LEGKKDALIDPGTNANAEAQNALRVTGDPDILQEWISHQMDVRRGDLARYAAESAGGASAFGAAP
jgi:hypothetical protein|tara:strand:+ start:482 stop:679 length:198 start_codon:yes stop_codon:yes gene_type:complete